MSLAKNALLTGHRTGLVGRGLIRFGRTDDFAGKVRSDFGVKAAGVEAEARSLSGGNLQKFIIGREIGLNPGLLILAYPTWGVDVGAATTIHRAIMALKAARTAVLIVSEDLDELFEICDRIAVIAGGRLSPLRDSAEASAQELGLWMSGEFGDQPATQPATGPAAGGASGAH
jgi:simple sugar transport system ATP-binding protein